MNYRIGSFEVWVWVGRVRDGAKGYARERRLCGSGMKEPWFRVGEKGMQQKRGRQVWSRRWRFSGPVGKVTCIDREENGAGGADRRLRVRKRGLRIRAMPAGVVCDTG